MFINSIEQAHIQKKISSSHNKLQKYYIMVRSEFEGISRVHVEQSLIGCDSENNPEQLKNICESLGNPSHLNDMGSRSFEERLDSLLSITSLNEFLKINVDTQKHIKDDDDDIEDELSRLNALELELCQELNRFQLRKVDMEYDAENNELDNDILHGELVYYDVKESLNGDDDSQYCIRNNKSLQNHATCPRPDAPSLAADLIEKEMKEKSLMTFIFNQIILYTGIEELFKSEQIANRTIRDDRSSDEALASISFKNFIAGKEVHNYVDDKMIEVFRNNCKKDLVRLLGPTWESSSKILSYPLIVFVFFLSVMHSWRMANYTLK